MADLVQAERDYSTYYTAKVIDAIATEEASLLSFPTKVFSFGANPPNFENLTAPFIIHEPARYVPVRHSVSGDSWKRDNIMLSLILCIHTSTMKNLQYPPAFSTPQLYGDELYDTFCVYDPGHTVRIRMCDSSGAEDIRVEDMQYGSLRQFGVDEWIGWAIFWRVIGYSGV